MRLSPVKSRKIGGWFLCLLSHVQVTALPVSLLNHEFSGKQLLIVGLGRVGLDCALLAEQHCFDHVIGTVRSWPVETRDDGTSSSIERIPFSDVKQRWNEASHVLWTIPLSKEKDENLDQVLQLLQNHNDHLEWIGMISTTGIYGNHDGQWVTEDSPLLCTPESNADLYRPVEQLFGDVGGQIFRCAGIYDSSRSALHTIYKSGSIPPHEPSNDGSMTITNRIHSYDIARAIVGSMKQFGTCNDSRQSRIYNLADDEPASRSVVLNYAADLLQSIGVPLTVQVPNLEVEKNTMNILQSPSKRERRRLSDHKLVSNQRMKNELLGPEEGLLYPTYREGLRAILNDPSTPWQQTASNGR